MGKSEGTSPKGLNAVKPALRKVALRIQREEAAQKIAKEFKLGDVTSRILAARGFEAGDVLKHYINPTLREGLPDPYKLKNLDKAAELISSVANSGGAVGICCDFDVDGLSGGAQIYHLLKSVGAAAKVYVPDRFEDGYGLNSKMIKAIAESGAKLVLTIDYGTTNTKELLLAKELGLKTIVVDHHYVGDNKPPADVFINPNQVDCGFANGTLCASGLAWYLVVALRNHLRGAEKIDVRHYLDLACLGTICDMVPLTGPNRVLAKRGLEMLESTQRPGLIALKNVIGIKKTVGCSDVSFGIGPRLNAAGRLVHGDLVIELLTTNDRETANKIARQLNDLNVERQATEAEVKQIAISEIQKKGELSHGLVVWNPTFHTGVIGIVAQRLVETFYRPAAVMGVDVDGIFKGSVRGIKGFSVVGALTAVGHLLIKFGGHEGAGGFSVEAKNVELFAKAFVAECEKRLVSLETEPVAEADTEVELAEVDVPLVEELKNLSPFGMGNAQPTVLLRNLKVVEVRDIKGVHLKAVLSDGKRFITGIMWRQVSHPAVRAGGKVNIVCRPDYNNFNGLTELQAILQAVEVCH